MEEEEGFDETEAQPTDDIPSTEKPALLEGIAERASRASIQFEWQALEFSTPDEDDVVDWSIDVEMPSSAGGKRRVYIGEIEAEPWLNSAFESWIFLDKYEAILDHSTNTIEAALRPAGSSTLGVTLQTLISGIHRYSSAADAPPEYSDASPDMRTLKIDTQGTAVDFAEFSPITPALRAATRTRSLPTSLKLKLSGTPSIEATITLLTDLSSALFFEVDTTYGVALALKEFSDSPRVRIVRSNKTPQRLPAMPKHSYSREATSLYFYGRSAHKMPLLQFLAFYQVLEFFFPTYARTETIRRFQRRLKDPAFDPTNANQVATLVTFLSTEAKALQFEEEQLKATIAGCTDDTELRTFIESSEPRKDSLSRKNLLKAVSHLNLQQNGNVPALIAQVAKRIYEIRNRIVHAKEDGGPRGGDLLLPFGPESKLLQHDIALARFLAQRVLIQGAGRGSWRT